ncbi:ABC transporter ATP-binding protein/permease, partial [Candidatus Parcubacteria bacterium]|nr:ABC transporter ATP-binding protein/permease [Candidatus Parcubacteria bacterium]
GANLKRNAYHYLMNHSYSFFTNNFVGSLVQKVNRFARAFESLADNLVWNLLPLAVRVAAIFIIVFLLNKLIAIIILIWAVVFLSFNIIFSRWKLKYDIQAAEIDSKTTAYLADTITNQNTVQLFDKFHFEMKGYKDVTEKQVKLTRFRWNLDALIDAGQAFLGFIMEFLLFFFAIRYWQQGLLTIGVFVLLQAYLITLLNQLWGFTRIVRDVYQSYADSKEMVEIMLLPQEITDAPTAEELEVANGHIEFKDLDFSFNETRKVLEGINLVIKPGERVALIGPSGAGKSTFIKLLLRLYSPTKGQILIDGQDIQKVTQGSLRKNISLVPQDPVLFHRTLADNIAYGKPGASRKQIEEAAQLAHCDEFIKNLPLGFETFVGERGIKLSGGERQRVAIARAMIKNAPVLVLDEATSSLDSHSELLIQDALDTLMAGKTTIVIAHRLSTIQKMDRIIVIDNGKIIEDGNHKELLKNPDSLYYKLWTLQAGGFLTAEDVEENPKEDIIGEEEENEEFQKVEG